MATTSQFKAVFTRYNAVNGREISAPIFFQAPSFREAVSVVDHYLQAFKEVSPVFEYDVVSLEHIGFNGTQCAGTPTIWSRATTGD